MSEVGFFVLALTTYMILKSNQKSLAQKHRDPVGMDQKCRA